MPKPDQESRDWFFSLVPDGPGIGTRPMFGNLAAFVNGNMFLALVGTDVAVRLQEKEREELLAHDGAGPFEPMQGRPMKEYVVLPPAWRDDPEAAKAWVERSLDYAASLEPKTKK